MGVVCWLVKLLQTLSVFPWICVCMFILPLVKVEVKENEEEVKSFRINHFEMHSITNSNMSRLSIKLYVVSRVWLHLKSFKKILKKTQKKIPVKSAVYGSTEALNGEESPKKVCHRAVHSSLSVFLKREKNRETEWDIGMVNCSLCSFGISSKVISDLSILFRLSLVFPCF